MYTVQKNWTPNPFPPSPHTPAPCTVGSLYTHSEHVLQWHLPARSKKGLVQYVGSVSACENHHTGGGLEAIHLN